MHLTFGHADAFKNVNQRAPAGLQAGLQAGPRARGLTINGNPFNLRATRRRKIRRGGSGVMQSFCRLSCSDAIYFHLSNILPSDSLWRAIWCQKWKKKGSIDYMVLFEQNMTHILGKIFLHLDCQSIDSWREVCQSWDKLLSSSKIKTAWDFFQPNSYNIISRMYKFPMSMYLND